MSERKELELVIIGKVCARKPGAWREKPSCPHFGKYQFFAAWRDNYRSGERIIDVPLCADCYREYLARVSRELNTQYAKAEREAEKLLKINQVLQRCKPMFEQVAA